MSAASNIRIAVASRDGKTVSGHIGKCADWIVYEASASSSPEVDYDITEAERLHLPKELVFHYYRDDRPHPLKTCAAKAAADYLRHSVVPPTPRPIGELICKIHDALSSHN